VQDLSSPTARRADDAALDLIFREARTHHAWSPTPVSEEILREIYDLAKLGPTALNCGPLRIVFLVSKESRKRLLPAIIPDNLEKVREAPVSALFAYDTEFFRNLPRLMPFYDVGNLFESRPELAEQVALVNCTLQAAYFLMAARALGVDCAPIGGFEADRINAEFFPDGKLKINFVCNLGYGKPEAIGPRLPRLGFDEACRIQ
jgi:3-hydroxypropanoate dehydrogenase